MKELVLLSGKGGTGKTSFAAALATLAQPLVTADTDVDAPNLRLLLRAQRELESPRPFLGRLEMEVDESLCVACGQCEDVCRFDAVQLEIGASLQPLPAFDPFACEGCGLCARICPNQAISMHRRKAGVVRTEAAGPGPMVTGALVAGEENSGNLVTLVRQTAREVAVAHGLGLILCDGPPGVGCPVIAAASHAGFILLVTEPSTAALHDLQRTADLASRFHIPTGVVLNKADLVPGFEKDLRQWCDHREVELLQTFPYSDAFFAAARQGLPVLDVADGDLRSRFEKLWQLLEPRIPDAAVLGAVPAPAVELTNPTR
jgi:MinD superfamily P-loop ATPase